MIGEIHPKSDLFLRLSCGNATLGKKAYEMNTAVGGSPLIKSEQTGKYWSVSWKKLLDLAIEEGLDEED
jgi:hypothetical protein